MSDLHWKIVEAASRWLDCSEECTAARLLTVIDSAVAHLHLGVLTSSARASQHAAPQSEEWGKFAVQMPVAEKTRIFHNSNNQVRQNTIINVIYLLACFSDRYGLWKTDRRRPLPCVTLL